LDVHRLVSWWVEQEERDFLGQGDSDLEGGSRLLKWKEGNLFGPKSLRTNDYRGRVGI